VQYSPFSGTAPAPSAAGEISKHALVRRRRPTKLPPPFCFVASPPERYVSLFPCPLFKSQPPAGAGTDVGRREAKKAPFQLRLAPYRSGAALPPPVIIGSAARLGRQADSHRSAPRHVMPMPFTLPPPTAQPFGSCWVRLPIMLPWCASLRTAVSKTSLLPYSAATTVAVLLQRLVPGSHIRCAEGTKRH